MSTRRRENEMKFWERNRERVCFGFNRCKYCTQNCSLSDARRCSR